MILKFKYQIIIEDKIIELKGYTNRMLLLSDGRPLIECKNLINQRLEMDRSKSILALLNLPRAEYFVLKYDFYFAGQVQTHKLKNFVYLMKQLPNKEFIYVSGNDLIYLDHTLKGHTDAITEIDYFFDQNQLRVISSSCDNTLKIWDLKDCLVTIPVPGISTFLISKVNKIITGSEDG